MKKVFTKNWFLVLLVLALGAIVPARAQTYTSKVLGTNLGISAICKDAAGNVYTVQTVSTAQNATQQNAQIVKYAAGTTTPTVLTGTTFQYSEYESVANYAFGLAIDGNGNIFVTTYNDYFPSDGRDVTTYGKILKMAPAGGNAYNQTTWVTGQYPTGNKIGDFGALAIDSQNNLFVDTYNDVDGKYEIVEYPAGSTTPTVIYTHLGDPELASGDHYTAFFALAFDPSDNLYAGTSFDTDNNTDGGKILQLTKASNYATVNQVLAGGYCSALATDASGRLYASLANFVNGTGLTSSRIVKFSSDFTSNATLYTGLSHDGSYEPWGLAVPSSSMIFAGIGGGTTDGTGHLGDLAVLFSTPATTASNVTFTATTGTSTTISWTNGNGASRAVFMKNTNTGQPTPVNNTTYTANTVFGSGSQIGATGWYCVYNSTGTTVDVTGLTQGQSYQVMVVEYNGSAGSENYLQSTGTNNPNTFITVSPTTITSLNRVTGQYSNAATVSFAAVFGSAVTGVTASNFSVTTTGVSGVTNASIGTPTTSDNITWTVPVSTGTGDGTIQLSLANATGMSKTISTSLPFAGQTYTIDKTAPTISIGSPSATITAGGPVSYTVTYADANFNSSTLTTGNITLNSTGTASGTPNVTGSGTTRTVTISGITGEGILGISIAAGTATDLAGNSAPAAGPSITFTVDNTAPTVAITRSDPNPIHDNVLDYQAVFSEPVTGVTGSSFVMTNSGVTTGAISATMIDSKTYNVTVATVAGNGTARLDLVAGGATDAAGNQAAAFNGGTNATYNVDQTAPTASSITATTPTNATPTNATSVVYTVTFSESVTGVDGTDFTLATSGTAGTIGTVTGSGTTYSVPVTGISGTGTLGLNLNSSGTGIQDAAGNPLSGGLTGDVYNIDQTAPTASSITATTPTNATPTNATSVVYTVTFSKSVTGVDGTDFTLATSGTTATIGTVTGSGTTYSVPVTGISGTGTLGLNLNASGTGIQDAAGNALSGGLTGDVYNIDQTAPTASSITATTPTNASPTNATSVVYTVTFSKSVTGVDGTDFTLATSGTAGTIGTVTGSGTTYSVPVTGISGTGTLGLNLNASGTGIQDAAGNPLSGGLTGDVYDIDQTAPVASSITATTPTNATPTNTTSVVYTVTFSKSVTGVDGTDFTLATSGTAGTIGTVTGSGTTYSVPVTGISGTGTLGLNLNASGTGIQDVVGNAISGGLTGDVYNIDNIAPTVASVTGPVAGTYGFGGVLSFTVHFDEPVNVTGTPVLNFTMDSGAAQADYTGGTGTSDLVFQYTIVSGDHDADGIIVNSLALNSGTIKDIPGNNADLTLNGVASMTDVLVDAVPPVVNSITIAGTSPTNATSVDYTVKFSKSVIGVQVSDFSTAAVGTTGTPSAISGSGDTYTVTVNGVSGDGTLGLNLNSSGTAIFDDNSNQLVTGFTGDTYTIDNTAPTIAISAPSQTIIGSGSAGTVTYDVTYADTYFNASTLSNSDITLNTTGTATGTYNVTGTGTTRTVTISGITGLGTLGITIAAGTASDQAGNLAPAAGPSATFTVASADASLSALATDLRKVAPIFNSNVTSGYTTYIPYTATATKVIATPVESGATVQVQVNGGGYVAAPNGSPSPDLALNPGANTIDVLVTAPDQATTKTYTITTTREHSSFLSTLSYSPPSLRKTKVSGSNYVDYVATVDPTVTSVSVTPVAQDPTSVITVNGETVASGGTSSPITLTTGQTTINTVVTTVDGFSTRTYSIVVTRQADALLSSLLYNPGLTVHKATGSHDFDYTATVSNSSIKVIPTAEDPAATIKVNGSTVASGNESAPIALAFGPNTINTVVTAADGVTTKTYSLIVTRQANALLSTLSYTPASLRKVVVTGPDYVDYTATVDYHVTETTVTPTVQDPTSTVTVNGVPVASGTASDPIALAVGPNTINTVVTAADGTTSNTYSIVITRQVDANLTSLVFNPGVTLHVVSGSHDVDYTGIINNSSVTVKPTVEDAGATVTVNGTPVTSGSASAPIALTLGENTITTVVTASDGTTTKTYSTVLTRQPNALLATFNLSPASIRKTKVTGPDYADYTASVANGLNSVTVTPTVQDPTSTVMVNGTSVASGTASGAIALAEGNNTITTVVTAEDGTTTNSYVIVINRAVSSGVMAYQEPKEFPISSEAVVVHKNVSPNGDGRGDAMQIDGISNYPDNKLQIMNRSGNLVYEVKGYDNTTKVFDGHNNDGKLEQAGTYFYSLEYKVGNETKRKTGYIVLKY